jgi:hypothetical protein
MIFVKKILTVICVLLLFTLVSNNVFAKDEDNELTLKEAYTVALVKAKQWDSKAMLSYLGSVDNPDIGNKIDGSDGKRRYWNVLFTAPETNKALILTIHDKEFVNVVSTVGGTSGSHKKENLIVPEDIILDSPEALKIAKTTYKLKPGQNWAIGYHFNIYKTNNKAILEVVGLNEKNKFTQIYFDATTGNFLAMKSKK